MPPKRTILDLAKALNAASGVEERTRIITSLSETSRDEVFTVADEIRRGIDVSYAENQEVEEQEPETVGQAANPENARQIALEQFEILNGEITDITEEIFAFYTDKVLNEIKNCSWLDGQIEFVEQATNEWEEIKAFFIKAKENPDSIENEELLEVTHRTQVVTNFLTMATETIFEILEEEGSQIITKATVAEHNKKATRLGELYRAVKGKLDDALGLLQA